MKNKGFTLIELLAVILILGIIALIAIPTVSSVVNQAREGAKKTTINNYVKAVDEYIMMQELSGNKVADGIYTFSDFADKIDIKGDISGLEGTIVISSSEVSNYYISDGEKTYTEKNDEVSSIKNQDRGNSTLRFPYKNEELNRNSILDFDKKTSIENIYFMYDYVPSNYEEVIELSNDKKIKGYLVPIGNNMYNYIVSSENNIVTGNSIRYLFSDYTNVKRIVFDNIDTSNTTVLSYLFYKDTNLEEIVGVGKLVTKKATSIEQMFHSCNNIKRLDLSNWDTSNARDLGAMFTSNKSLVYLDVSTWNTTNVTSMAMMFHDCYSLQELNITNFDTHNVTNMNMMFQHLTISELDLSSFDTQSVTTANTMFYNNPNLRTIYVSDKWDLSSVTTSNYMFENNLNLVGKIAYSNSNAKDKTYATIDGYLTLKQN